MIVWSGLGFLILVVIVACIAGTQAIVNSAFHSDVYYQSHRWPKAAGFLLAALVLWRLAMYLADKHDRHLVDPATGKPVIVRRRHSLFVIPMRYWAPIMAVVGVAALVVDF